ncbi:DDE-type integrase/transposase/recombinase [Rhizobium leguminosarum]|uniref:integrase catalytic domain-containing protein n=1 Tax=Rhizobium TaxID=379 RepID=UPI0010308705|nr:MULTISPECIES: DDE-type integrase/transposase/recombinase [Rhizobium]MCJ9691122.1 DDE-type integrase/transposase/recombinase [Rhizobium sp. PRIMUS64]NEJ21601.1 DDE-type integrase/transposase/recombinase [Rhizobium leguminosarum]TAY38568.1 integrase [Rhizobium leguminosarum]
MNMYNPYALATRNAAPMFWLGDAKSVKIDNVDYTVVRQTADYSELRNKDGFVQQFSHATMYILHLDNKVEVDRQGLELSPLKLGRDIVDVPEDQARRALVYADAFDFVITLIGKKDQRLAEMGWRRKVTLGHDCLDKYVLPLARQHVLLKWTSKKAGKKNTIVALPNARHFRRLYNLYIEGGCDPAVLVSRRKGPGSYSKAHPADLRLWTEFSQKYATDKRPSMRFCFGLLQAEIKKRNEACPKGGHLYKMPSRNSFEALIKGMGEYFLHAARFGEDAAKKKFAPVRDGLQVFAPGERVEMDEWKVDLHAWFILTPVWLTLTEKQREALTKVRVWVTVAIDVATRCIVALRFSTRANSSHSSIAALEMIVTEKEHIAEVAGAESRWIHSFVPRELVTDAGAGFIDTGFRQAVAALHCVHTIPPAGMASARGTIESVFRSFGQKFLAYFDGRTFSSVYAKGDYDGEGNAVLNVDEVCRFLTRAIVDIYHHQPHSGLGGETPANAWMRLSREYAMLPPLSQRQRRVMFGTVIKRKVSARGIVFLGIHYQSRELERLWAERAALPNSPSVEVKVRIDRFSLRTISFHDGFKWRDLTAEHLPEGVSVWEWTEAMTELSKTHAKNVEINLSTMLKAINDLREAGIAAAARAELGTDIPSEAAYRKVEHERFAREITMDVLSGKELAPLAIAHDPLTTSIEEFRFLARNKKEVDAYLDDTKAAPELEESGLGYGGEQSGFSFSIEG